MTTPLNAEDRILLERVPAALDSGLELMRWWRRTDRDQSYRETYPETFVFNRPEDRSFGFFDTAELSAGPVEVNGNVQEMFYDEPKSRRDGRSAAAEWTAAQLREFILHYFLRVSDYRQPQRAPEDHEPTPPGLGFLSQCPQDSPSRSGFGFQQLFHQSVGGGWQRFRESQRDAVLDLRKIGREVGTLVLRNPIYAFEFDFMPVGPQGPKLSLPLRAFNYLALSEEFVIDEERPEPSVLGRYGLGYAFVRSPDPSAFGYGPGELEPAFELLVWTVHESGEVTVKATFVAERPKAVLQLSVDPFVWGFQVADTFGGDGVRNAIGPFKRFYRSLPFSGLRFDPVFPSIGLLNLMTLGQARKRFCISREQFEKEFLFLHFRQHYQTILGSLQTWRQIPDWLDRAALPPFVVDGRSS